MVNDLTIATKSGRFPASGIRINSLDRKKIKVRQDLVK